MRRSSRSGGRQRSTKRQGAPGASTSGGRVRVPGQDYYDTMPQILFHGPLMKMKSKRGIGIGSRWNKRYFTVEAVQQTSPGGGQVGEYAVCYFYNKQDALRLDLPSREPGAWFYLSNISYVGKSPNLRNINSKSRFPHGFVINTRKRELYLRAETTEQYAMWVTGLQSVCGLEPTKDLSWPGGELGPKPPLLVGAGKGPSRDNDAGGKVTEETKTPGGIADNNVKAFQPERSAGQKVASPKPSFSSHDERGLINDLRDWSIKSEGEGKEQQEKRSLRNWDADHARNDSPADEDDFNFPKSAGRNKDHTSSRRRHEDEGKTSTRLKRGNSSPSPQSSERRHYSPSPEPRRGGSRSPEPRKQRSLNPEFRDSIDDKNSAERSFEDTASSNSESGSIVDNNNNRSDRSDMDDDLDEWLGEPKKKKPVATGTKLELQSHTDFYEDNWQTQTKLKRLNEKKRLTKGGSAGVAHDTVQTLTDSEGTDDTMSTDGEEGAIGQGTPKNSGRQMLPGLDSFDDMGADDELLNDVEDLLGGGTDKNAALRLQEGEKIQSRIEDAMKRRITGGIEEEQSREASFASKTRDEEPRRSGRGTDDVFTRMDRESSDKKKSKKSKKKSKKSKKKSKKKPQPPGLPQPPKAPPRPNSTFENTVAMDSNFLHDKFDSDSDTGDSRRGESKHAFDNSRESKTSADNPSSGPSANLVREDSNWLDDDFDDGDIDEDEPSEGKTQTAQSPRSAKAGVTVDKSFASSDWDKA